MENLCKTHGKPIITVWKTFRKDMGSLEYMEPLFKDTCYTSNITWQRSPTLIHNETILIIHVKHKDFSFMKTVVTCGFLANLYFTDLQMLRTFTQKQKATCVYTYRQKITVTDYISIVELILTSTGEPPPAYSYQSSSEWHKWLLQLY